MSETAGSAISFVVRQHGGERDRGERQRLTAIIPRPRHPRSNQTISAIRKSGAT